LAENANRFRDAAKMSAEHTELNNVIGGSISSSSSSNSYSAAAESAWRRRWDADASSHRNKAPPSVAESARKFTPKRLQKLAQK